MKNGFFTTPNTLASEQKENILFQQKTDTCNEKYLLVQ